MELTSIFVGLIIVFIIFAPIIYFIVSLSATEKKIKKSFLILAKSHNIHPNQVDVNGSLVIGIDSSSKKLVFSKKESLANNFEIIDLSKLDECKVKTLNHTNNTIDWVAELLEGKLRREIAFYIEDNNDEISGNPKLSLESAKHWEQSIKLSKAS